MFTLPDLPYAYNALEPYIDELTMRVHHDKHHATYAKNLNDAFAGHEDWLAMDINNVLAKLDQVPEQIRMKVRNNGGGVANHSLFWQIMGPNLEGTPRQARGDLGQAINRTFGSWKKFVELFSTTALSRFGSGWAWLVLEDGKLKIEDSANQDSPISLGHKPILCLDVWEHAYYLKYQNLRADYIKAWWNVVNWTEVEKRFAGA